MYQGGIRSQSGDITVRGKQVEVDRNHIQVLSKDKLHIESQTPTPETPVDIPKPTLENPLHTPTIQPIPHIPSKIVVEDTQEELPIVVDTNSPKNRQPILDTTRNGIDILHIAGVDGNGISHNAYTQFNVKERGLILNNATKYTKTQLAGYIDKNMFLAGNGAKTIINEVTSTNPSTLKGYIEVAGNPADVVIVNPNGMTVNGFGVINGAHMTLQGKDYIDIVGKGYGGQQIDSTFISDHLRNRRSELWGRHLRIDTDTLENTGNIAAETMHISAKTMHNAGFVESKDTLQFAGNELVQDKGIMKANQSVHISANHIRNSNSSVLEAGNSVHVTGDTLQNDASHLVSHGVMDLGVGNVENTNTGAIIAKDTLQIQGNTFANTKGILFAKNDAEIDMKEDVTNTNGLWHVLGNLRVQGRHIRNINIKGSYFGSDMYVKGNAYILGKESFENRSSDVIVKGDLTISAPKIQNHKDVFKTGWTISEEDKYEGIPHLDQPNYYEADRKYHRTIHTGTIEEETATSRILSDGTIHIIGQDVQNTYSQIMAKDGLQVTADSITNTGYQGTVHYDDIGRDRHYWKYKQKKRWWKRKKWVYGHTDIPYEHHEVFDAESSPTSERIAVLGSHGTTSIQSNAFTNTTLEADGTAYAIRDKKVETTVAPTDVSKLVTPVLEPSKQLYMTTDPLAVAKVEDNPLYTDKKQFLSSDYMVARLQADPERVYTRLRNGYEDQEIAKEELRQGGHTLTKYTGHDQSLLSGIPNSILQPGDLRKDGSIVLGKDVQVISQKVDNTGTIQAKDSLSIVGNNVRNLNGSINGNLVSIRTDMLQNTSGRIHGKDGVHIEGKDIRNETQVTTNNLLGSQQDTAHGTASITSDGGIHIQGDTIHSVGATIQGNSTVNLAGKDIQVSALALQNRHIASGVTLESTKYLGSTVQGHTVQVQGGEITLQGSRMMGHTVDLSGNSLTLENVTNKTLSDVAVGARGSDYFNRKMVIDEQNLGATIEGETGVKVRMDNNVSMKGSTIHSKTGLVDVQAGRVSIAHGTERHETLSEIHQKDRGFLSSTTRDIYDHKRTDTVVGSTISSGTVKVDGKQDVLVKASHIVGDADVTVTSEGNLTITSAQEESGATHREEVRKSGIFGNGGLSLTIGTQKQRDTYDAKSSIAKGSVIGSRFGSVTLGATGTTQIEASDVASKGDIQVQGSGVIIRNGYTTSHTGETHRFSKSGLTLSLSNRLVDTTTNAVGTLTRANSVKDERLKALLAYKTYDDAKTSLEKSKLKDQAKSLQLNLSLGAERSEASTNVDSKIAKGSTVVSDGHIRIATKKDDIRIEGSDVQGKDITLESANSIYVKGKETTSKMSQSMKQKQGSLGISYDLLQHRFSDISVNASGSKGSIAGTDIVHDPTKIIATNTLGVTTTQDVHIKDGVLKGDAIEANVGRNLEIRSVQDTHDYTDHTTSGGMGLSLSKKGAFKSLQSSLQRTDIDSKYTSVIHQSGLYAGGSGFNISVGNTTTLEGALLSSQTDRNTLKTKYLDMKDMENRAKYSVTGHTYLGKISNRINIGNKANNKIDFQYTGIHLPPISDSISNRTKTFIAKGSIVTDGINVSLKNEDSNIEDNIYPLPQIFIKNKAIEKSEYIGNLSSKIFTLIGDIAYKKQKSLLSKKVEAEKSGNKSLVNKLERNYHKWGDGGLYKVIAHGIASGFLSSLGGYNMLQGGFYGSINEYSKKLPSNVLKGLYSISNFIAEKSNNPYYSLKTYADKFNWLTHEEQQAFLRQLMEAESEKRRAEIIGMYFAISNYRVQHGIGTEDEKDEIIDGSVADSIYTWTNPEYFKKGLNYTLAKMTERSLESVQFSNDVRRDIEAGILYSSKNSYLNDGDIYADRRSRVVTSYDGNNYVYINGEFLFTNRNADYTYDQFGDFLADHGWNVQRTEWDGETVNYVTYNGRAFAANRQASSPILAKTIEILAGSVKGYDDVVGYGVGHSIAKNVFEINPISSNSTEYLAGKVIGNIVGGAQGGFEVASGFYKSHVGSIGNLNYGRAALGYSGEGIISTTHGLLSLKKFSGEINHNLNTLFIKRSTNSKNDGIDSLQPSDSRAQEFEKAISKMPVEERIGTVLAKLKGIASDYGWEKVGRSLDGRIVYKDNNGFYYTIDTMHGRFEKFDRNMKHIDEVNIDLIPQNKQKKNRVLRIR